jgi:multisubunit Na+/H+ antiporter MnhE subunit
LKALILENNLKNEKTKIRFFSCYNSLMVYPRIVPGLKIATAVVALLAVMWISLEGDIRWSLLMASMVLVISVGYFVQRFLGGKKFTLLQGLIIAATIGLGAGLIIAPLVVTFMAIKTGLHGHGPEFTLEEIKWAFDWVLLWAFVGSTTALGLVLLYIGFGVQREEK